MRVIFVLLGIAVASTMVASAHATTSPITDAKVSPSPFYSDEPRMAVSFRTLAPAPAGQLYFLFWQTFAAGSTLPPGCSPSSKINALGYRGGTNTRVTAYLYPEPIFGDAFCPGPSKIDISVAPARSNRTSKGNTSRLVGKMTFRVQRP